MMEVVILSVPVANVLRHGARSIPWRCKSADGVISRKCWLTFTIHMVLSQSYATHVDCVFVHIVDEVFRQHPERINLQGYLFVLIRFVRESTELRK